MVKKSGSPGAIAARKWNRRDYQKDREGTKLYLQKRI
jgi:hypothetical protein